MARGRKAGNAAATQTAEDRLKAALVPEEEWPYPVPENWLWVRLNKLYAINPKVSADDSTLASFVPMEKVSPGMTDAFSFEIAEWGKIKKGHTQFANGDVAFAKISPCFENRKSMTVQGLVNNIGAGTTELIILRSSEVCPKYTYYLLLTEDFIAKGKNTYSGTVGQQRINMEFVKNYPVPLPPLPEQQRIVDRIESLFAKLDEAKEKAQAALDSFEARRAAILHKAFTGELTAKWREENGVSFESWRKKNFFDIFTVKSGTTIPITDERENGVFPYIKVADMNLKENLFEICTSTRFVDLTYKSKLFPKRCIIFPKRGGAIFTNKKRIVQNIEIIADLNVMAITPNENKCRLLYAYYWFLTIDLKSINNGSNIPQINNKDLIPLKLYIPRFDEQDKIINLIEDFFRQEEKAKYKIQKTIEIVEITKKSILARAFRGELGTNDLSEKTLNL